MPAWKKVIVSGSNAHLTSITASQVPTGTTENVLLRASTGEVREIAQSSLLSGLSAVTGSGTQNYITRWSGTGTITTSSIYETSNNIGIGTNFTNPSARLHISGASDSNLLQVSSPAQTNILFVSASGNVGIGTSTPTLGMLQLNSSTTGVNPSLYINASNTATTASIIVRANNGVNTTGQKTYNPVGGSDSLNFIQLLDGDATSTTNQPIGRIIFSSNDTDTSGSGTTKAFIEAVSEDETPDAFLAFGTNQSGSAVTERMRITSVGNVGIGTTSPTNKLQVDGGITVLNITASGLPNTAQANIVGYNSSTGQFTQFSTSSLVGGGNNSIIGGSGIENYMTMWGDGNTIKTSSIFAYPVSTHGGGGDGLGQKYLFGWMEAGSPTYIGARIDVSGSTGRNAIRTGFRRNTNVDSYATYVFADTEGPKIGFGSYDIGGGLSGSWGQMGVYNQAFRIEAFTTGTHTVSGGIKFFYSGSEQLTISASSGTNLVGINKTTPTNTLDVGGGITAVNITASANISSSAGLIGATLNTSGNGTIGGNLTTTQITASGNISSSAGLIGSTLTTSGNGTIGGTLDVTGTTTLAGNLLANGNTTLGNQTSDTVTITAATVTAPNLPTYTAGIHNNVLIQSASNIIAKREIDSRVWGSTLISGSGVANQIAYFNAATGIVGDTNLTYNASTDVLTVNGSTFGQDVTIAGNLTVNGDTTVINTSNISIEDKFIILGRSSGSLAPSSEGGIIVEGANGSGSAFVFNSGSGAANGLANSLFQRSHRNSW